MRRVLTLSLVLVALLSACSTGPQGPPDLRILVPNAPGSGYDVTARVTTKALSDAGIRSDVEAFNLPGGGGVVGLQRLGLEAGNSGLLMLMGLGVVGSQLTNDPPVKLTDTTPIARLLSEPGIVVVRAESPYRTMDDLVAAWQAEPAAVPVGGGSAPGGPDHIPPMLIARAIGIEPAQVDYRQYDGGGDLLAAILDDDVAFGVSGISEYSDQVRSGQLRVLAVSSPEPTTQVLAPTLREVGIDVVFANWRGIVAPPDLPAADVEELRELFAALHGSPQWKDAVTQQGWTDAWLPGDEFGDFIAEETERMADLLAELDV